MHDVRVLDRPSEYEMQLAVVDPDSHMLNPFYLRFCPTYRPTSEITAGTTFALLKYRRDLVHDCADISNDRFGYILRRNEHGIPIIAQRRQTPSSTRANTTTTAN